MRQTSFGLEDLPPCLFADDAVEVANHQWIGMRSECRTEQIISIRNVRHPVAQGFADRILQGATAARNRSDLRAQQAHTKDVEALPPHVFLAHINHAFESEKGARSRGGNAVLPRSG